MIKHIVAWNFPEADRAANIAEVKRLLEQLPSQIPEIKYYEIGVNLERSEVTKDLILISAFEDTAALKRYAAHPKHRQVVEEINKRVVDRVVVDFQTDS